MSLKKRSLFLAVVMLAMFAVLASPALASDNVYVNANPGSSTPGGIAPDPAGDTVTYNYVISDGQAVTDSIPVQLCMTGSEAGWNSIDVTFGSATGNLSGSITLPSDQTFFSSQSVPDCRSLTVQINTGALNLANPSVSENFVGNFNLAGSNPNPSGGSDKPNVSFADYKVFHIRITVLPAQGNHTSCFLTNSEGLFLSDCSGQPVSESGSDKGRFAIVANKKNIEVSTNPGQFYFNFVWLNTTGVDQTVDVTFARTGVNPQGAQAIHSAVFNGYLTTINPAAFDEANLNGIPDGTDDEALGILVPAGSSLLVTYHLTWSGLSAPVPVSCGTNCPDANQLIRVTGQVSNADIDETCTAEAYGYKK